VNRFTVRLLEEGDLDFAYQMTAIEGWNERREDVKRMLDYEPEGCFVAEIDKRPAGHAFSVNYGKLGWIGYVIVKAEYRWKGIGTALTAQAKDYLLNRGVEIVKLEAVPMISNLYRKLGFIDEYDSLRFRGIRGKISPSENCSMTLIEKGMIADIAEFDAIYFGAKRTRVLDALYRENPDLSFLCHNESGVIGYIMCRKAEEGYKLGPWVCKSEEPEVAKELFAACLNRITPKTNIYVGVPAVNTLATGILQEFGFELYSKSIRMRFGKKLGERVNGVLAIGGPMKG